jgi:hypothetical protein
MSRPDVLTQKSVVVFETRHARSSRASPEARQRRAKTLVVGGWIVAMIGVVLYCTASFAANTDADLAAIVLEGAIPAAAAALILVAAGTALWLGGSILHLNAVMDAGGEAKADDTGRAPSARS